MNIQRIIINRSTSGTLHTKQGHTRCSKTCKENLNVGVKICFQSLMRSINRIHLFLVLSRCLKWDQTSAPPFAAKWSCWWHRGCSSDGSGMNVPLSHLVRYCKCPHIHTPKAHVCPPVSNLPRIIIMFCRKTYSRFSCSTPLTCRVPAWRLAATNKLISLCIINNNHKTLILRFI